MKTPERQVNPALVCYKCGGACYDRPPLKILHFIKVGEPLTRRIISTNCSECGIPNDFREEAGKWVSVGSALWGGKE